MMMSSTKSLEKQSEDASALVLQNKMRARLCSALNLHRKHLSERLLFESKILWETARFINQVLVFVLLLIALRLSSDEVQKKGIYDNLQDSFDFEYLQSIQDRQEFVGSGLSSITGASKDYFLRSSMYFDDQGAGGTLILRDVEVFTGPKSVGQLVLNGAEFSFTAWVRTSSAFVKGHIVRKGLEGGGQGAEDLSCWSWYLATAYGQQLHFGGHDYFAVPDTFPAPGSGKSQEEVSPATEAFVANEWTFLTLSVTGTTATFFENLRKVGSVTLPKLVTDCLNTNGIQIGAAGMELGGVRYHRSALIEAQIAEMMSAGGSLAELSTGWQPTAFETSEVEALDGAIAASFARLRAENSVRQRSSDANFVLHDTMPVDPAEYQSAAAPLGSVTVNQTLIKENGARSYVQLTKGPSRLTSTAGGTEAEHRFLTNWPSFRGSGATISFWYRHQKQCIEATDPCGLYLLDARDGTDRCWSLWVQSNPLRFWVDTPQHAGFLESVVTESKYSFNGDKTWRHVAMVMDEEMDEVRVYVDGTLAARDDFKSEVEDADCSSTAKKIGVGHAIPGYTYGGEVELYDMRMYVHGNDGPVAPEAIRTLSESADARTALGTKYLCQAIDSPLMQEQPWADRYGHTCAWYAEHVSDFPGICDYPGASANCPNACNGVQECWLDTQTAKAYYTWDGIKRVAPGLGSPKGAICLKDDLNKDDVIAACEAWVADGGSSSDDLKLWLTSYEDAKGERLDLRDCDQVAAAVNDGCAFDAEAVRQFTQESQAANGDFSIAFWIRPLGQASLQPSGRFIPHVQFLSSVSPPTHHMAWGLWENPNGEVRLFSDCENEMENIEMKAASEDEWTFIAISKRNPKGNATGDASVLTNTGTNYEGSTWNETQCPFNAEDFVTTLEVNYPAMITPIMMVPQAVPVALLQQAYLKDVGGMRLKAGPAEGADDTDAVVEIEKEEFEKPSILVAPPIIFQTRTQARESCPSSFGKQFIQDQHERMLQEQCKAPYECDAELLADPNQLLACSGEDMKEGAHFGIEPLDFQGDEGYADFLFSVTDSIFLARNGELFTAQEFLDGLSTTAKVMLVFFTPGRGITTVLSITADLANTAAIEVGVEVEHFEIVEGADLQWYMALQILVLVPVTILVCDVFVQFTKTAKQVLEEEQHDREQERAAAEIRRRSRTVSSAQAGLEMGVGTIFGMVKSFLWALRRLLRDLVDLGIAILVVVYVVLRIPATQNSADEVMKTVGDLGNIDWSSREISLDEKTKSFLNTITDLNELLGWQDVLNRMCTFVLVFSLLRLIKCTSMHPRLALLEGTLVKAWDDLWHSALLILLLMTCFAGIATWRFGAERGDFADFETSLQSLFEMTFGEFPEDWTQSFETRLFTVLYFMIVFLLVQNFLLAVVVEAYMDVRRDNEALQTEQEFLTDISTSFASHVKAFRYGWPSSFKLGNLLEEWSARRSLGYKDLLNTGMFRNKDAIVKFIKHYRRYDFLHPDPFDEYGPLALTDQEKQLHQMELRMAKQMGTKMKTLKEFAAENIQQGEQSIARRQARARGLKIGNGMNGNGVYNGGMNGNGMFGKPQTNGAPPSLSRSRSTNEGTTGTATSEVAFVVPSAQLTSSAPPPPFGNGQISMQTHRVERPPFGAMPMAPMPMPTMPTMPTQAAPMQTPFQPRGSIQTSPNMWAMG